LEHLSAALDNGVGHFPTAYEILGLISTVTISSQLEVLQNYT